MANAATAKMAMDATDLRERRSIAIGLRVLPGSRSPAVATAYNRAGLVPPQQLYCAGTAPSQSELRWSGSTALGSGGFLHWSCSRVV